MKVVGHFINGETCTPKGRMQDVYNPATGEAEKLVLLASKATVNDAIVSAQNAFVEWRNTPVSKRARVMFKFKSLLEEHADEIIALIGAEHGKISHDAAGELQRGIENVEFACGAPQLLKGEHSKNVGPSIDSWSEFQPLGVVAGITPFNFPAMVPLWMFPLAIVCGKTFVLKPSERDPSCAIFLAKLLKEAGLPDGVFNVINGDKEAVDQILDDERIKAVSFVGSTPIAEYIYSKANANGKRCMALSVVVAVGDKVADEIVDKMQSAMKSLKVGAFDDATNDFGPLITLQHKEKVEGYITSAAEQGADVVVDGRNPSVEGYETGFFLGATLIDKVTPEMASYKAEIFGPVLQVMRVKSMEQAMQLIDSHEYGNGTCIFTRDGEAARYFSDNIQVGMVGINVPLPVPVSYHSFGGWKRSLFGDLHAYGPDGVRFYTKRKTITQRWPSSGIREGVSFSFPS